jgi:hypothetical protein
MKRVLTALMIMAIAVPAFALQNPDIRLYLDATNPPTGVAEIHPEINEFFDVFVVLDCFGPNGGTRGVGFLFDRTFAGVKISQTNFLGGLSLGDVEDAGPQGGWAIVAGVECVYPDVNGWVVAGAVNYLYLGTAGTITVLPNPVSGREVLDCDDLADYFCVAAQFGVSMPPPDPEPDCECPDNNPVEDATWGSIKGLYR